MLSTDPIPSAAGPGAQVTKTDSKSVDKAMKFELTLDNFTRFTIAADSISVLEARDPTARAYLGNNLTDAGSTDSDAGLKWLESNDAITRTIESAGLSVRDYFVEAIAIATAERFMNDPKAAPPTATLQKNAKFVAGHKNELAHLQALRDHKPDVIVKP